MTTVAVKPHPDLDPAAWPLLIHPASGGLLDAQKQVPVDGRPWLNDGFTARLLTDGAILRADDPLFAERAAAAAAAKAAADAEAAAKAAADAEAAAKAAAEKPETPPPASDETPPAH